MVEAAPILFLLMTILLLMSGVPVGIVLGGASIWAAFIGHLTGIFDLRLLAGLPSRWFGIMTNEALLAIPLFCLMGVVLERSGIAERLLVSISHLASGVRGSLALSVVIVGAVMAASSGIVGATVVTMGLVGLPAMLRCGYPPTLATGTIAAAGTLGQIIPPSIALVILGDVIQGAHQQAELAKGNFAPDPVSVVDLFAGALLPGLLLVSLYAVWILFICRNRAPDADTATLAGGSPGDDLSMQAILRSFVPPSLLILAVLGLVLFGIATPAEAAGVGAVGAILLALGSRSLDRAGMVAVLSRSVGLTAMIFFILLGASLFSLVFRGLGGDALIHGLLIGPDGGLFAAMTMVMAALFLLGFFLEFVEITLVVIPVTAPALLALGADPIWLAVMIAINLQTSFLTPPFGVALFYLRGVTPPDVETLDIYRGVVPFVVMQLVCLLAVAVMPWLATWLPGVLFR